MLLSTIHDHVTRIDTQAVQIETRVAELASKVTAQEQNLKTANENIEKLFSAVANLERKQTPPQKTEADDDIMQVEECTGENERHILVVSNLPDRSRDEEDISALMYVGLSMPADEICYKNLIRHESKTYKPGNVTIEFNTFQQKLNVLKRKRQLQQTVEYKDIYIQSHKTRNEIITENNFIDIMKALPQTHNLKMSSNGRIKRRMEYSAN